MAGNTQRSERAMQNGGMRSERKGTMVGAQKNCPKPPHACADDLRGEGDDDSGAGTFYFTHLHFPGPSFEIDQFILVLGDEPQIICYMQQKQVCLILAVTKSWCSAHNFILLGSKLSRFWDWTAVKKKIHFFAWNLITFPNYRKYSKSLNRCYKC